MENHERRQILDIIDSGLGDILAESNNFEKAVNFKIDQVFPENALVLNGILTITHQIEVVIKLLREVMEEQYQWTKAIESQVARLEKRLDREDNDG
jgi:hypothetical protein